MKQYLEAGQIVNTHGIRGELRVQPWCDSPEFLAGFERLWLDGKPRQVRAARAHKGLVLLWLEGVDSVEAAMALRGKILYIDRAEVELAPGEYFIQDILGCTVHDLRLGRDIGVLREVSPRPAGDLYVVEGPAGEILIPARPEFLREIDLAARRVTVETIPGMGDADDDAGI